VTLTIALQVVAFAVLGGPLLATGRLIHDPLRDFYFFRDALHSLNVYGEIAWWNPSIQAGFPFYYFQFLRGPGREPIFALISAVAWLLGRMGVTVQSYQPLYVVYFALLVPLLLSLSVLALARQILRRRLAIYLVIAMLPFSPGVMFSLSDLGIEVSAYGFFFAAALIHFLRAPHRSRFLLLCLAAMALALALTYFDLFWNVFFVPAFILLLCVRGRRLTRRARDAAAAIPPLWWAAALAGVIVCALPSILAYAGGSDILSVAADGRRYYEYSALVPGTPLEALAISTPGVGFSWTESSFPRSFEPRLVSAASGFISFGYMGLLTLPLALLGIVLGRPYWSIRLYGCIAAVITIVLLSAYSPILSLLIGLPTPLRVVNHYSDEVVRVGLFALFALAAGLGLEAVLESTTARRWILPVLAAATSAASVAWLIALQRSSSAGNYLFGLTLALILIYGVALARLGLARTRTEARRAVMVLLVLTLVDTSTFAFAHLRLSYARDSEIFNEPRSAPLGSVTGFDETELLYLKGMDDPALLNEPARPIELVAPQDGNPLSGQHVDIVRRTYNSIAMRATAPQPARLEWHDAYFPFWRASVNGRDVTVERTKQGMKAVAVPAGTSDVVFRFSPVGLRIAVAIGYLAFGIAFVLWIRARRP
jgi:hypothetical protein